MFQLPVSGPNSFLREEEIIAAGSTDACVFPYNFDGNGTTMTDATKAESAENCGWRGDSPEPQLDDISHDQELHLRIPDDTCSWHGDPAEPELDDLAHHPKLSPKSQEPLRTGQQLLAVKPEPSNTLPKAPQEKAADAPPSNKPPPDKDKEGKGPDGPNDETLQERVAHGVQQAFNMIRGMVESTENPGEPEPSKVENLPAEDEGISPEPRPVPPVPSKPQSAKAKKSKEDKEKAKREKVEARKADKERKVKEKEEKKKLKKEKEEAKKEQRRKSKDKKKKKGKETTSPPPDLPAGAEGIAAAEADPQPGCQICQHPEEEGTLGFLRDSLENWQGLPSLDELTDAAKRLLNMTEANELFSEQEAGQSTIYGDEQELIDHIVAHIDRHIHQHFDLGSPEGGNPEVSKAPPLEPNPTSGQKEDQVPPEKQLENGSSANHGLDGNRDWPLSIMQNHILRSLEPISTPDIVATRPPQACSPYKGPVSRCVSPWCEQLGFTVEDSPPSFAKRNGSWLRRGHC